MDEGLFKKYSRTLSQRKTLKEEIIQVLQEKAGVTLEEDEFILEQKKIRLLTSSVKKNILLQNGVKDILSSLGFTLL